jgi:MSHA biogenesis protein MshL
MTFRVLLIALAIGLGGCATQSARPPDLVLNKINDVLLQSASERRPTGIDALDKSMMPPLGAATLPVQLQPADVPNEARFDLSVMDAPAVQVFPALVTGTGYSMLVAPEVSGNVSLTLKNTTVLEALDTVRELYGYEYRVQGKRIFIEPNTMKTRVFHVNYLSSQRTGHSALRVSGGANTGSSSTAPSATTPNAPAPQASSPPGRSAGSDSSSVSMSTYSDFWSDLKAALTAIVGDANGRSVVMNPSSGVIVVRALPGELRGVEKYLRATQLVAERQVMLEAKIVDVTLNEEYQAGVNWGVFNSFQNANSAVGVAGPGAALTGASTPSSSLSLNNAGLTLTPGKFGSLTTSSMGKGFIGLAFQTANFAGLLNFLESQGTVSVLSSPRIATLNNQKAVLKVGSDEFFVTNLTVTAGTTTTAGTTGPATITPQFQSMFSGISLDVTPQIDDEGNIILHVHPAVTSISESQKSIDLGGATGLISIPLAISRINETDSIVRAQDGNIVAIGGLMRQEQSSDRSQLPGASGVLSTVLGQRGTGFKKRELVILIKPTIIQSDRNWTEDLKDTQERLQGFQATVRKMP